MLRRWYCTLMRITHYWQHQHFPAWFKLSTCRFNLIILLHFSPSGKWVLSLNLCFVFSELGGFYFNFNIMQLRKRIRRKSRNMCIYCLRICLYFLSLNYYHSIILVSVACKVDRFHVYSNLRNLRRKEKWN